ncbi:uncharacterized protein LOC124441579 [Xenia sp. Carnegie-2017]|uniref:uncharacterized protein LOC124441579 n=1 Tax=Xenia sp. Carnegie-2017 TaxID=2897299 RepID=UPI001F0465CC|nr:uncharacterized protein LOC124441579 [Xenia sp. Carnegie-2017]
MKKKKVYTCFIQLSLLGYVLYAKCGCSAGVDGRCNHVCATLFYVDSVCKNNLKQCKSELSCTSKPCDLPEQERESEEELISPIKVTEIPSSLNTINERVKKIRARLVVDDVQAKQIKDQTRNQSSRKSWHTHRKYRITASKCYRAAVLKSTN